jgi:hypothetical protein
MSAGVPCILVIFTQEEKIYDLNVNKEELFARVGVTAACCVA